MSQKYRGDLLSLMFKNRHPFISVPNVMVRSDTDVLKATPGYTRSMSAPLDILEAVDDSIVDIMKLQR